MKRKKTRKRRSRAQRAEALRRRAALVTETAGAESPDATETTEQQNTASGLLEDPRHIRSNLILLRQHMGCGAYSQEQLDTIFARLFELAATGNPRVALGAVKVMLAQTKLSFEMNKAQETPRPTQVHQHAHVHTAKPADGFGSDFLEIAATYGIPVDVESLNRETDVLDGEATEGQAAESDRGAPSGGDVSPG